MTTTPHKHHAAITAWANGETIEWSFEGQEWKPLNNNEPRFNEMLHYRVKPAEPVRKYPETTMTDAELIATIKERLNPLKNLRDCVNAALRHAIDSGQVVAIEDVDPDFKEVAAPARSAEKTESMRLVLELAKKGEPFIDSTMYGTPLADLTHKELRGLLIWLWKEYEPKQRPDGTTAFIASLGKRKP